MTLLFVQNLGFAWGPVEDAPDTSGRVVAAYVYTPGLQSGRAAKTASSHIPRTGGLEGNS